MLWEPSDHSCKTRTKRRDGLLQQVARVLGMGRQLCQLAFHQVSKAFFGTALKDKSKVRGDF